ncbi:GNAT family N-acetyltransferase, partial [Rhodospirillales bacterium 47_12_T64]
PTLTPIEGKYARLEILDAEEHAQDLFEANSADEEGRIWSYLSYGPYANL